MGLGEALQGPGVGESTEGCRPGWDVPRLVEPRARSLLSLSAAETPAQARLCERIIAAFAELQEALAGWGSAVPAWTPLDSSAGASAAGRECPHRASGFHRRPKMHEGPQIQLQQANAHKHELSKLWMRSRGWDTASAPTDELTLGIGAGFAVCVQSVQSRLLLPPASLPRVSQPRGRQWFTLWLCVFSSIPSCSATSPCSGLSPSCPAPDADPGDRSTRDPAQPGPVPQRGSPAALGDVPLRSRCPSCPCHRLSITALLHNAGNARTAGAAVCPGLPRRG